MMVLTTTHERVADVRRRFDAMIRDAHLSLAQLETDVRVLVADNAKLPHSEEQQDLANDMLAYWVALHRKDS